MLQPTRITQYAVISMSYIVGGGSLVLFFVFVYTGSSLGLTDLKMGKSMLLAFDALLCLLFFLQHSIMIRKTFKERMRRIIPAQYHMAVYSIASGTVLLILVVFWQDSHIRIYNLQGLSRVLPQVGFFVCVGLFVWGGRALGAFDFLGVRPIKAGMRGKQVREMPFMVRGPYRWVRHPLYLFVLLMIWARPDLTIDRLLFNVLFTVWIVLATVLEERDLVDAFGEAYRGYQRTVPMLFPRYVKPPV